MQAPRILVIDNVDSFTFMLVDYLVDLGADVSVKRNDALALAEAMGSGAEGFLISPGPGTPEESGISVALAAECIAHRRPLLGVCLGHQAIALACGSKVERTYPVHGKTSNITNDGSGLFQGLPTVFVATRYHSLAVPDPARPLIANAWSDDGMVMAMRHEQAPVHGVQFHPESVASDQGKALLAAFLRTCHSVA